MNTNKTNKMNATNNGREDDGSIRAMGESAAPRARRAAGTRGGGQPGDGVVMYKL